MEELMNYLKIDVSSLISMFFIVHFSLVLQLSSYIYQKFLANIIDCML